METNYSWIVPFSWVICVLRVDQILSIKSSVWTLFWTCRLNEFHLTSKRHVTNRIPLFLFRCHFSPFPQKRLILRLQISKNSWYYVDNHHGTDRQLFHYFLLPWDTHTFIIMVNSQLSKQNITRPYHCGLSCVFRRDYVLKFYADQLMILRSGSHVTQKYLQHRNTKSLRVSQKVKFISSIIHISFRFLLVFASIYTDLPLRL